MFTARYEHAMRHRTPSEAGNNNTRSTLHNHVLYVFCQLRFASNGLTLVVTIFTEDVKITVVYSLWENNARLYCSNGVTVVVTSCSEDVKIAVVYSLRENSARLILQTHLNLSVLINFAQI